MEELLELKKRLETVRPATWSELPDLALYMDQVVGYLPRQHLQLNEGDGMTSAMVNNYIKEGLLPRADGKRYNRSHLVYLTAISALKQVLSVKDMGALIQVGEAQHGAEELYSVFCGALEEALTDTAGRIQGDLPQEELPRLALALALRSYADRLACQRIIDLIRPAEPDKKKKK